MKQHLRLEFKTCIQLQITQNVKNGNSFQFYIDIQLQITQNVKNVNSFQFYTQLQITQKQEHIQRKRFVIFSNKQSRDARNVHVYVHKTTNRSNIHPTRLHVLQFLRETIFLVNIAFDCNKLNDRSLILFNFYCHVTSPVCNQRNNVFG